jgi:hypothetical protein
MVETLKATMDSLAPVRDPVLGNASLTSGETLLDAGAGLIQPISV